MAHQVKIAALPSPNEGIVLPNGINYTTLNQVVTLTDEQFARIDIADLTNGTLTDLGPVLSMGHKVTAAGSLGSSNEGIDLGNGVTLLAGQSIILDDNTFSRINPAVFTDGFLVDNGPVLAEQLPNAPRTVTAADTMVALDSLVRANAAGGAFNETLPAQPIVGRWYTVANVGGANNVTVVPNTGQTLTGGNKAIAPAASNRFIFDGTAWTVV